MNPLGHGMNDLRWRCPICRKPLPTRRLGMLDALRDDPRQRAVACLRCGEKLPARLRRRVKFCPGCWLYKDRSAFQIDRSKSRGLNTYCRPCQKGLRRNAHRIDPRKNRARAAVARAVEAEILKREPCENCGAEPTEAHHPDYARPLDVQWLCQPCHADEHRRKPRGEGSSAAG